MFRRFMKGFVLAICSMACSDSGAPAGPGPVPVIPVVSVASVRVTPAVDTLVAVGESMAMTVEVLDGDGNALTDRAATWVSSDPAIAEVTGDASGATVNALAPGPVTISAGSEGVSTEIEMRMVDADLAAVAALLNDEYTGVLATAIVANTGDAMRNAIASAITDLSDRFLSGVRDNLAAAKGAIVTSTTEDDAPLFAVLDLMLDHAVRLLNL